MAWLLRTSRQSDKILLEKLRSMSVQCAAWWNRPNNYHMNSFFWLSEIPIYLMLNFASAYSVLAMIESESRQKINMLIM